jgi:hypothetical protein
VNAGVLLGVFVDVLVGGTCVFVRVLVGGTAVFDAVLVGGTGVLVALFVAVFVGDGGVLVLVGGTGLAVLVAVLVAVGRSLSGGAPQLLNVTFCTLKSTTLTRSSPV